MVHIPFMLLLLLSLLRLLLLLLECPSPYERSSLGLCRPRWITASVISARGGRTGPGCRGQNPTGPHQISRHSGPFWSILSQSDRVFHSSP